MLRGGTAEDFAFQLHGAYGPGSLMRISVGLSADDFPVLWSTMNLELVPAGTWTGASPADIDATGIKLNLGSGHSPVVGYVNVDNDPLTEPDLLFDLNVVPWPWRTSSVTRVAMNHTLGCLGRDYPSFAAIWGELYRVLEPGGVLVIETASPAHWTFAADPSRVRPITPRMLAELSPTCGSTTQPSAWWCQLQDEEESGWASVLFAVICDTRVQCQHSDWFFTCSIAGPCHCHNLRLMRNRRPVLTL